MQSVLRGVRLYYVYNSIAPAWISWENGICATDFTACFWEKVYEKGAAVGGAFFHSDNPLRRGSYCLSWYVFLGRGGFHRRRIYAGCNLYDDNGGSILWGAFH